MEILTKSLHVIEYEKEKLSQRTAPESFDQYVSDLIDYVNSNDTVREFKTRSVNTEVISCIKEILEKKGNDELVIFKTLSIANRLLHKEIEAQKRVARLDTNVQKGSLVQALLYDGNKYFYLLAKVEHIDFVDDLDFSFKSGFSKDKKKIWKSCVIDLTESEEVYYARIYSNTVAKYWSDDFLELEELVSDEKNTSTAFRAIETYLNRNIKKIAPYDYTVIRNSFISYFRNNEHLDYDEMINDVIGENYEPSELSNDKIIDLREKLKQLPENKHFDHQFISVPSAISARIKKVYDINTGIQLRINSEIKDISNTIMSVEDADGTKYIKIRTNNDDTYRCFESK